MAAPTPRTPEEQGFVARNTTAHPGVRCCHCSQPDAGERDPCSTSNLDAHHRQQNRQAAAPTEHDVSMELSGSSYRSLLPRSRVRSRAAARRQAPARPARRSSGRRCARAPRRERSSVAIAPGRVDLPKLRAERERIASSSGPAGRPAWQRRRAPTHEKFWRPLLAHETARSRRVVTPRLAPSSLAAGSVPETTAGSTRGGDHMAPTAFVANQVWAERDSCGQSKRPANGWLADGAARPSTAGQAASTVQRRGHPRRR
jgi:hypothetical protein